MLVKKTVHAFACLAALATALAPSIASAQGVVKLQETKQPTQAAPASPDVAPAPNAVAPPASVAPLPMTGAPALLQAGTRIYLSLDELVTSRRGSDDVGTIVRCRVWRDVEQDGVLFIKAGTPATCRVDKVSRRNIGGFEGSVAIGGVETKSVDGQLVTLTGGYHKDGDGHKVVVLAVGLLLLWPVLFVPGGNAELPPGTVFDTSSVNDLRLAQMATPAAAAGPVTVDLRSMGVAGLSAEFMVDDFVKQPKHDTFRIKVSNDGQIPQGLVIDSVNGKPISPISLNVKDVAVNNGQASGVAEAGAKEVAKYFVRGINRFEVSYTDGGQRRATEVIMNVQM
ncbi:MAG TPA: hypothetical protein VG407_00375 [Caulobacteraceae bacterium]|jgi:hypothetical protein|nr:hypothetical protein [Caulobacteraceae bacterium]